MRKASTGGNHSEYHEAQALRGLADAAAVSEQLAADQSHNQRLTGKSRTPTRNPTRCFSCKQRKVRCSGPPFPCLACTRLDLDCRFGRADNHVHLQKPTEQTTEAGIARRRTLAACQECRSQKIKCSGQRPECHRCIDRGLACSYQSSHANGNATRRSRPSPGDDQEVAPGSAASSSSRQDDVWSPPAMTGSETGAIADGLVVNSAIQHTFLRRDVLSQHIEAYFVHIYPFPGYDFFHKPSLLEDLHNDRIPVALSAAICAAVSMYVSRAKDKKQVEVQWSKDVDGYLFNNMNKLSLLNLQIILLSMLQHFVYRQFGRVWLMMGMATKLALALQLNKKDHANQDNPGIAARECARRTAWSVFLRDKQHSGGADEFVSIPEEVMQIPLPTNEDDFQFERERRIGILSDPPATLANNGLGMNGYIILVWHMRHEILKMTKAVISKREAASAMVVEESLAPLLDLQERYAALYASLPKHLTLSDRGLFLHSTQADFSTYVSVHTWYLQGCCDLYRICLPGAYRESASPSFLANAPAGFVTDWRNRTVSCAWKLATIFQRLLELKSSGSLILPGGFVPLSPEGIVNVHQCTKVLLVAQKFQLYSDLADPFTQDPIALDDGGILQLCNSNVAFLADLASVAPIAAVVQHDIRKMVDQATRGSLAAAEGEAHVTSDIQQEKILSRYHLISMGIAATKEPSPAPPSADMPNMAAPVSVQSPTNLGPPVTQDSFPTEYQQSNHQGLLSGVEPSPAFIHSGPPQVDFNQVPQSPFGVSLAGDGLNGGYWAPPAAGFDTNLLPGYLGLDYTIEASQTDMGGELNWFLSQSMQ